MSKRVDVVTMRSRYNGWCVGCGKAIKAGEVIEWNRATRQAYHQACAAVADVPAPYHLSGGEGYGYRGWKPGQVVRASDWEREQGYPEFLYVVRAGARYIPEEGMSLGVRELKGVAAILEEVRSDIDD